MAAILLRNSITEKSLHPISDLSSNLPYLRRIPSTPYPFPRTLPFFPFPIGCLLGPALGTCSRVWGSVWSGSGRKRFEFGTFFAASDGNYGGGGGVGGDGGFGGGGGGGEEAGGNDWPLLSWYLTALDNHPVATKSITSAFLTLIGDLICQLLIDCVPKLDGKRTFVFTFLGLMLVGPTLHFWYLSLSKLVSLTGLSGASLRLLLDQFLFSPIFIGIFLCALVTLEGRPSQVLPKLQQVLAANIVALAWNVILSFKAHKEIVVKQAN